MLLRLSQSRIIEVFLASLIIIVLPFSIFYWIMPFVSDLMMGSDFRYSVHQQMEMLFAIKMETFPLYHPTYALGTSSITLTFSQVFHPIVYLCSIMPGYWDGRALQWYEFFKILSLGLSQFVLFAFIRKLRIDLFFSFLISFVVVYNLRMLDLFRFGASLEAYTAYLVLCSLIGMYFINTSRWLPLGIIIITYLLIVSGHPQMMFYGLLGSGIFLLVAPFFLSDILDRKIKLYDAVRFWLKVGLLMTVGIILSSNYILPFYFDFYTMNVGRVGQDLDWSTADIGIFELLNNFFLPLHSDVHGAFGGSSILLLMLLLPLIRFFKIRIPLSVWGIWGIMVILLLYMLGEKTPVYKLAWQYIPFVSSFRHQGRASMVLPSLFLLLLIWIANVSIKSYTFSVIFKRYVIPIRSCSIIAFFALFLIPIYVSSYLLFKPYIGEFPPVGINKITHLKVFLIIFTGWLSLVGIAIYDKNKNISWVLGTILSLMAIIQVGMVLRHGTFTDPLERQPTYKDLKELKKKGVWWWSDEFINMHSYVVITQLNNSFMEPFLGRIFTEVIPVSSQGEAYRRMRMMRLPYQAFIEDYNIEKAKKITREASSMRDGEVRLVYSSYNRLDFKVKSEAPAIFGLSYPYTGHWRAWVNGEEVKVYRVNGGGCGVEVPTGESVVEFRYWSNAFVWGMIISGLTFILVGIYFSLNNLTGIRRIFCIVVIPIIGTSILMAWYNSLYKGENLEINYVWRYAPSSEEPNIAYGKKTSGVYLPSTAHLRHHSSRAVDGDRSKGSGFVLNPALNDYLIIDLNKKERIKEIIIYGNMVEIPLVFISDKGNEWNEIATFIKKDEDGLNKCRVVFNTPAVARYVKVQPSISRIGIDEVEVYRYVEGKIRSDSGWIR